MARHWLMVSVAALLALPAACVRNRPPDAPARPEGPTVVAPGDSVEYQLVARDPEGQSVSFRLAWDEGDTSGWSLWTGSGETLSVRQVFTRVGSFRLAAQARDPQEALSDWSEPLELLVGSPPRRPTRPDGPAAGWVDTSYSYTTVSTDPDADELRYIFDWGDGAVETTAFVTTGQYVTREHVWDRADTFDLIVRALDRPGLASAGSETLRVSIRDISGPGVVLWQVELGTGVAALGGPAIDARGRIIFGATDGLLRCLEPNGNQAWGFGTRGAVQTSPAIAADGSVLFGSDDSTVYCLTGEGAGRWEYATGGEVRSSPAIAADGAVLVGSDDGGLYCLEPDGRLRWSYRTGGPVRSSPAIGADGRILFGSGDSFVYALRADGTLDWRYRTGDAVDASPALAADGTVHVASRDGRHYALDPDGGLRWQEELGVGTVCSPAVGSDGSIFVGSETGRFFAFYETGGPVWEFPMPGPVRSSPLVGEGLIVYFGAGRRLYAIDARGMGGIAWHLVLPGMVTTSPALANGIVYVGDSAGGFRAVRAAGGLDTGPWPKYRHDARNTGRAGAR